MERTKKERSLKKFFNRSFSYLVLLSSIFALCYSFKKISDYARIKKENIILEDKLTELRDENDRLEILNSKLKDKDYFSIYVKDKYQYSSNNESITPIN